MRVLVCGGRDYTDYRQLCDTLRAIHTDRPITAVIHGAARGADTCGWGWATSIGIKTEAYPANWDLHGRKAGPIRNQQMLDEGKPDLVVAFPGGRGTADMVRRAKAAGIDVVEVK